jgi:calcineurin-like phosphoesterase family protein
MHRYFTSDTHFGQATIIFMYRRPFATKDEMDATMIARWNEIVRPQDEVWHLGDFAVGVQRVRVEALLAQLHGVKHLVTGNNDPDTTTGARGWASVQPYAEVMEEGTRLVLCHYPFRSWHDSGRGSWNLHGHSHGRMVPLPRQQDVGVDVFDFRPVTFAQAQARRKATRSSAATTEKKATRQEEGVSE